MDEQQLMELIVQLKGQAEKRPGGGFGKVSGYDTPGAVSNWLWSQGYSGIGPMLNNAPPIVRQMAQQPGMKMDPTQYRSVGGYTPQFSQALNQQLYPGMNFRTGEQSMGDIIGKSMGEARPQMSAFNMPEYNQLQQLLHDPRVDERMKKQILDEYLQSGGQLF